MSAVKNPLLTFFNSISKSFKGIGTTVHLFPDSYEGPELAGRLLNLDAKFVKIVISIPDPGRGLVHSTDLNDISAFFTSAPYSTDSTGDRTDPSNPYVAPTAERFFSAVKASGCTVILCFVPPESWLSVETGGMLTGEPELYAFANLISAGIAWVRSYSVNANLIQLFHRPDDEDAELGNLGENDYLFLADSLRDILLLKGMTSPAVQILSPGLSQVLATDDDTEPYTEVLVNQPAAIDIFALDAIEHIKDLELANAGTFASRKLLGYQVDKNVAHMNSVNYMLDKIATFVGTRATKFAREGVDLGESVTNSDDYAVRVVENLVSLINSGFSSALLPSLSPFLKSGNNSSLYDGTGNPIPLVSLMNMLTETVPIPGDIYQSEEMNKDQDRTIKTLLMSGNRDVFTAILCRSKERDALDGKLRLVVNNPLWSTAYRVDSVTIRAFPDSMPTTEIVVKSKFSQGTLQLDLSNVPYDGAVLFMRVATSLIPVVPHPEPLPDPIPEEDVPVTDEPKNPVVLSTIVQVPVYFGVPLSTSYGNGTLYYDSKSRKMRVFIDGLWVDVGTLQAV